MNVELELRVTTWRTMGGLDGVGGGRLMDRAGVRTRAKVRTRARTKFEE